MKGKSCTGILSLLYPFILCLLFLSFGPGVSHSFPVLSFTHFACGAAGGDGAGPECISGTGWRSSDDGYAFIPAAGPVSWNQKNGQKTGLYSYDEEELEEDSRWPFGGGDGAPLFPAPFSHPFTGLGGNSYYYLCAALLQMGSALCIVCILHKTDGKKRIAPVVKL
ncbi:hypothetical protein V3C10_06035 [[Clostridium] symbiosum]|uniref:hypothetical protein n=1 Tax=Clostridium symbiosum TaxID=1512 RepID=UPI001D060103|nr:hypothetical protein [[Clostridium] symbiosum]MCB6609508.1 hypothetical protein [[Clostridium] symbiosum]MCB6929499.1 hypothetical protein [[Clostridium] symbiosum]